MAYTETNFKSKKELKQAVAEGKKIGVFNPGLGGDLSNFTGKVCIEGPHYPAPHTFYATATLKNGIIVSVK